MQHYLDQALQQLLQVLGLALLRVFDRAIEVIDRREELLDQLLVAEALRLLGDLRLQQIELLRLRGASRSLASVRMASNSKKKPLSWK